MAYELATPAIQAALIARLEADAALAALLKTRPAARGGGPAIYEDGDVYDGQTMPYLTIGLWTQTADHLFSCWGWTCTGQIKAISQRIDKPPQVMSAVLSALEHGTRLDLPGYDSAWIDEINAQPMFRAQQAGKSTFELPIIVRVNVSEAMAPPVVPPSPLLDDLVSYWSFDADWNDLHGTNHLTNVNGVTSVPGRLGNAGAFAAASTQYLSHVSNSDLQLGDRDWTIQLWMNIPGGAGNMTVLAKDAATREYHIDINASQVRMYWVNGGVPIVQAPVFPATTWGLVLAWYDATANTLHLQLNNGSVTTVGDGGNPPPIGNDEFRIGHSGTGGIPFNGLLDEVAIWHRLLTADERAELYNSGTGLAYPFNE